MKNRKLLKIIGIIIGLLCLLAIDVPNDYVSDRVKYDDLIYFEDKEAENSWKTCRTISDKSCFDEFKAGLYEIDERVLNQLIEEGYVIELVDGYVLDRKNVIGNCNNFDKIINVSNKDVLYVRDVIQHEIGHYIDWKSNQSLHMDKEIDEIYTELKEDDYYDFFSEYSLSSKSEFIAHANQFYIKNKSNDDVLINKYNELLDDTFNDYHPIKGNRFVNLLSNATLRWF